MTVYFAHVGADNSLRDFPRTIGTGTTTVSMTSADFGQFSDLVPSDVQGFQTWGIPSGAAGVHKKMCVGEWFILAVQLAGEEV
jgi:hypothetical protein